MGHKSVVIETTHGLIHFPYLTMQIKSPAIEISARHQTILTDDALIIPPMTTEAITALVEYPSEWNTTGTTTPLKNFTEAGSLLISQSMSTRIDKKVAVKVTNTTESPCMIRKNTQNADFLS